MQSHAIDGRRGIYGDAQDDDLGFYLAIVDTNGRIWQLRLREVETRLVRVHYGEALILGWIPPMRRFLHQWLVAIVPLPGLSSSLVSESPSAGLVIFARVGPTKGQLIPQPCINHQYTTLASTFLQPSNSNFRLFFLGFMSTTCQ